MKRDELHDEIHSSILLFKDKHIDEHELQIAIESMVDDYHENQLKLLNKQNVSKAEGVSLPDLEYWKQRCILMEHIDEESPCDPDITSDQIKAYANFHNFIKEHGQRQ